VEEKGDNFVKWRADDGYPDKLDDPHYYDINGCAAEGYRAGSDRPYRDLWVKDRKRLEDGVFLFNMQSDLRPGDKMIFRGRFAHVNLLTGCDRISYEDVTIFGGSGFGFMESDGNGATCLRRIAFTPGPPPKEGAPERLISVCDATHTTNMRTGIRVIDCYFEKMTDDATNVNGTYGDINSAKKTADGCIVSYGGKKRCRCADFTLGDRAMIYTKAGKLVTIAAALERTVHKPDGELSIHIDKDITAEFSSDLVIENINANGAGFIYENCVVKNNRSRGFLIKASDGIIRHCTLRDNGMSAILVKPEISDNWGECGFSQNLILEDNDITETGYFTGSELHCPINIEGDCGELYDERYLNHKNITVRHNRIGERYSDCAIKVNAAVGVVIEDNEILPRVGGCADIHKPEINPLAKTADDIAVPVYIAGARDVKIKGNKIPRSSKGIAMIRAGENIKVIN
jgi:hypothetical protein